MNCVRSMRTGLFAILGLMLVSTGGPTQAALIKWKNDADGKWHIAANWEGNVVPAENDDAENSFLKTITHDRGDHAVRNLNMRGVFDLAAGSLMVRDKVLLTGGGLFKLNGGKLSKATVADGADGGGFFRIGDSATSVLDGVTLLTTDVRHISAGTVAVTGNLSLAGGRSEFRFAGGSIVKFDGSQEMKNGRFVTGVATIEQTPGTALTLRDNRFRMSEAAMPFALGNSSTNAARPTSLNFKGENSFVRDTPAGEAALNLAVGADEVVNAGALTFTGSNVTVTIKSRQFENLASGTVSNTGEHFTLTADTFTNRGAYEEYGISTYKVKNVVNNGVFEVKTTGRVVFDGVASAPRADTAKELTVVKGGQISFLSGLRMTGGTVTVDGNLNIREGGAAAKGIQQAGAIGGNGTINGGWKVEQGFVKPGKSTGMLTIEGDHEQADLAQLDIELSGCRFDPSLDLLQYDRLAVTGLAGLDGLLSVVLVDGFVPLYEDTFDILTADAGLLGSFLNARPPSGGLSGRLDIGAGSFDVFYIGSPGVPSVVRLANFQAAAVPEPASWMILGLGLMLALRATPRRRASWISWLAPTAPGSPGSRESRCLA